MLTILFFHQPVDATTTRLYCFDLRNDIADGRTSADDARSFQLAVAAEDQALVERLVDKSIPLDLQAEVHTRADRITVEMRRILGDLVAAVVARPEAVVTTAGASRRDTGGVMLTLLGSVLLLPCGPSEGAPDGPAAWW